MPRAPAQDRLRPSSTQGRRASGEAPAPAAAGDAARGDALPPGPAVGSAQPLPAEVLM
ncbi:hypothetical protein MNEG_12017, partial [Monoraphidium neglectum]